MAIYIIYTCKTEEDLAKITDSRNSVAQSRIQGPTFRKRYLLETNLHIANVSKIKF